LASLAVPSAGPRWQSTSTVLDGIKALQPYSEGLSVTLVTDEFGGVEGLVTLNDLMEGIVGDLSALEDEDEPSFVIRQDGS
jgi:putative hemolysin